MLAEKCAPIVVFAYNRPDHLSAMLRSLSRSPLIERSPLYIFCDGCKDEESVENVTRTQNVAKAFASANGYSCAEVIISDNNIGLANSVIQGVSSTFREFEKVIVLEDDLILSAGFLLYANQALERYYPDERIWSISGFSPSLTSANAIGKDVFFSQRGCSWGWCTWRDRWETVDWEVSTYNAFEHSRQRRIEFAKWGADLPGMLDAQMHGLIDSWAIRWCYEEFLQGKYTVYPAVSFITNCGMDGSGTHSVSNKSFEVDLCEDVGTIQLEDFYLDEAIRREFKSKYSTSAIRRVGSKAKWYLRRLRVTDSRCRRIE